MPERLAVRTAALHFRIAGEPEATLGGGWTVDQMTLGLPTDVASGQTSWPASGVIPPAYVTTKGVDYFIEVTQGALVTSAPGIPGTAVDGVDTYWHVQTVNPPVVAHVPPAFGVSGEPLALSFEATCSTAQCEATLYYRTNTGAVIDEPLQEVPDWPHVGLEGTPAADLGQYGQHVTYTGSIPASVVDTRGVDYFVHIEDGATQAFWPGTTYQGYYLAQDGIRTGYHHTHVLEPSHVVHAPVPASPYRQSIAVAGTATCSSTSTCEARLYYRTTNRTVQQSVNNFDSAPMTITESGSPAGGQQPITVAGTIPANYADTRGVDYFLSVTDGSTTAWWPGTSHVDGYFPVPGQRVGYQHVRVQDPPHVVPIPVGTTRFGEATAVAAAVSCATETCSATLHYAEGLLPEDLLAPVVFTTIPMQRSGIATTPLGAFDRWAATIPGEDVTTRHLMYYIEVSDGYVASYSPGTEYSGAYVPMDGQRLDRAEVRLDGINVGVEATDTTFGVGSTTVGSANELAGLVHPIWVQQPPIIGHLPVLIGEERQPISITATANCATPSCTATLSYVRSGAWHSEPITQQVIENGTTGVGRLLQLTGSIQRSDVVTGLSYRITVDDGYVTVETPAYPVEVESATALGSIGDRVWFDSDADGVIDTTEAPAVNVTVTLEAAGADAIFGTGDDLPGGSQDTDYRGAFRFSRLVPGRYRVSAAVPAGATLVTPPPTSVTIEAIEPRTSNIGIRWNGMLTGVASGDSDRDGSLDAGEPLLQGRQVYALRKTVAAPPIVTDGGLAGGAVSGPEGGYTIEELPPGDYWAMIDAVTGDDVFGADTGTTPTWTPFTISVTEPTATVNFGRTPNDDEDNDGFARSDEVRYGTSPTDADSDDDGLLDGFEAIKPGLLSPLDADSDDDSITDAAEDFDADGLTNVVEQDRRSSPTMADTDSDDLRDDLEAPGSGSSVNDADTDDDTIDDGRERAVGLNPGAVDSDGDGVPDPEETLTTSHVSGDGVAVTITGTGDLGSDLAVVEQGIGAASGIAGQVSAAYDVHLLGGQAFTSATITIPAPADLPAGVTLSDLRMLRFDDDRGTWLPFEGSQTIDAANRTVTATVSHFSIYALFEPTGVLGLTQEALYPCEARTDQEGNALDYDIALILDSSGSMTQTDPNNLRVAAALDVVDALQGNDRAAVIDFDSTARVATPLTSDKAALRDGVNSIDSSGGTNLSAGVQLGLQELAKSDPSRVDAAILLTDGIAVYDHRLSEQARSAGVPIFTVGLGADVDQALLRTIALDTRAGYYQLRSATELELVFQLITESIFRLGPDRDLDGLTDCEEIIGVAVSNGHTYRTDPGDADTDNDGLDDGDEIGPFFYWRKPDTITNLTGDWAAYDDYQIFARRAFSDPTVAHSDGDGLDDFTERSLETDAFQNDSDGDGLDDAEELHWETDPNNANTDNDDGPADLDDAAEVADIDHGLFPWVPDETWESCASYSLAAGAGAETQSASDITHEIGEDGTGAWFNGVIGRFGGHPANYWSEDDAAVLDRAAGGPIFWASIVGALNANCEAHPHPSDNLAIYSFEDGDFPGTGDGELNENVGGYGFFDPRGFSEIVLAAVQAFPEKRLDFLSIAMRTRIPLGAPPPVWAIEAGIDPRSYLRDEKSKILQAMYPQSWPLLRDYGFSQEALQRLGKSRSSIVEIVDLINMPNHRPPVEGFPDSPFFGVVGGTRAASGRQAVQWYVRNRFNTTVPRERRRSTTEGDRYPDYREATTNPSGERWHEVKAGRVRASSVLRELERDIAAIAPGGAAVGIQWNFFASGISNSIGAYRPLRAELDALDPTAEIHFTVYPTIDADYVPPQTSIRLV